MNEKTVRTWDVPASGRPGTSVREELHLFEDAPEPVVVGRIRLLKARYERLSAAAGHVVPAGDTAPLGFPPMERLTRDEVIRCALLWREQWKKGSGNAAAVQLADAVDGLNADQDRAGDTAPDHGTPARTAHRIEQARRDQEQGYGSHTDVVASLLREIDRLRSELCANTGQDRVDASPDTAPDETTKRTRSDALARALDQAWQDGYDANTTDERLRSEAAALRAERDRLRHDVDIAADAEHRRSDAAVRRADEWHRRAQDLRAAGDALADALVELPRKATTWSSQETDALVAWVSAAGSPTTDETSEDST